MAGRGSIGSGKKGAVPTKSGRSPATSRSPGPPTGIPDAQAAIALAALSEGVVLHLSGGEIAACNPAAERILGLTRDQIAGKSSVDPAWRAVHEDGSPFPGDTHPAMVTLRTGERRRGVLMGVHRPDGSLRWISVNSEPVLDADGTVAGAVAAFAAVTDVRAKEEERRDSEERYRSIFKNAAEAIIEGDAEGGVLAANPVACRLVGRSGEELRLLGLACLVPPGDTDIAEAARERGRTGLFSGQLTLLRADGTTFPADVNSVLYVNSEGRNRTSTIFSDVTERVRAEAELKRYRDRLEEAVAERSAALAMSTDRLLELVVLNARSNQELIERQEHLRQAQEAGRVGSFEWDVKAGKVFWSRQMEALHGLPPGGFDGRVETVQGFVHPEDLASWAAIVPERLGKGGDFRNEFRIVREDGEIRWMEAWGRVVLAEDGSPVRMNGMVRDSSERKAAERAIRESEERLRLAEEVGRVGSFEWELVTNRVIWSAELERMHGLPVGGFDGTLEMAGRFLQPEDRDRVQAVAWRVAAGGDDQTAGFRIVREDGEVRWFVVLWKVFREGEGRASRVIGTVRDVTDWKKAEESLRARGLEVEESNRELEAFSYVVSHDLRAPLRAVHGFASLLGRHLEERLDPEGRRLLGVVEAGAATMGRLIDGLLTYTQIGRASLRRSLVDMKALAEQIVEQVKGGPEGERFEVRVAELPAVEADPVLVAALLRHLLSNAAKFSSRRDRPEIEVGFEEGPDGTVFLVRDNGVGFDPAHAAKLFGVFDRLHAFGDFEGDGIGLALAKRIVERHGGWIRAEGAPDRGATFRFTLGPAS